jgi:hypothetical protein
MRNRLLTQHVMRISIYEYPYSRGDVSVCKSWLRGDWIMNCSGKCLSAQNRLFVMVKSSSS